MTVSVTNDISLADIMKIGTAVGGIIGTWIFITTFFMTTEAAEQKFQYYDESMLWMQIDIAEDRLYRLRLTGVVTNEQKAKEKQLEKRIDRLEGQLDEH